MGATSKQRTPSRCSAWERERRNKFNQAISKLGELIKAANREANSDSSKDADNTQYPKIEIIQRAIISITDFTKEKSKLKAEILALQVKLESQERPKRDQKDVSTQINIAVKTKVGNKRFNKLIMLNKSKNNVLKEKQNLNGSNQTKPVDNSSHVPDKFTKVNEARNVQANASLNKLTKILPKSVSSETRGPENTIVVVPATPYIVPQRQMLFPTAPPTFVLLNPNMQPIKKSNISINRTDNDITKTTMVNILPISAYSRPHSATKAKKNNVKQKNELLKKKAKSIKKNIESSNSLKQQEVYKKLENDSDNVVINTEAAKEKSSTDLAKLNIETIDRSHTETTNAVSTCVNVNNDSLSVSTLPKMTEVLTKAIKETDTPVESICINITDVCDKLKDNNSNIDSITALKPKVTTTSSAEYKVDTTVVETVAQTDRHKMPNILDSTLCEHTVDGGNARLELAEELLAASPTAAFLMSFPLVSGNRADSPAEDSTNMVQNSKENNQRRPNISQSTPYYEKAGSDNKNKSNEKQQTLANNNNNATKTINLQSFQHNSASTKQVQSKSFMCIPSVSTENPFLNIPTPSIVSTSVLTDSGFPLDFDCNISKPLSSQNANYGTSSNLFYKNDHFNTVKSTIYSTSAISSGHDFNSLGLYPCAMEKYSSKSKGDYTNVEDNLMKIGSSRLTYDIDLGWSHKGFDFVNCTTSVGTFSKDTILTTVSTPVTTSYNPFNPEFHVPLVSSSSKKDNCSKPTSVFADTIASFYSQAPHIWSEDMPFYTTNNISSSKPFTAKHQNYLPLDHSHACVSSKQSGVKPYEAKSNIENCNDNVMKSSTNAIGQQINDKYTKKSPSKMHINWMTSETRPVQSNFNNSFHTVKENNRFSYGNAESGNKKHEQNDTNYFPLAIHNYPPHTSQEDFQVWPSTRPLGTTEISIDPPPINLPTLIGDLALGPHDKKKIAETNNRGSSQGDLQNCGNFLSVTQLMNRSTDNMSSRYQAAVEAPTKYQPAKQTATNYASESLRKVASSRLDNISQPCYSFNDPKIVQYESGNQYHTKNKSSKGAEKSSSKHQKHSYSAEALIRSGSCTQSGPGDKLMMPPHKYPDSTPQLDSSVAQVSHFTPIIDYSDSTYTAQQFSGTTLYNSSTNTISNSFYSNFMPGSTNLMSSNYSGAPFPSEFIDYTQTTDCNYSNQKYEEFKIKGNPNTYHQEKNSTNHKSSRREYSAKHKLECSKKDSNKKYQSKRPKLAAEVDDWSDSSNMLWQNKTPMKKQPHVMSDEVPFPNYVGNQVHPQYQADIFNSHLVPPNVQAVHHNADRSLPSFPLTSRANFNLSTIFPEITMKVQ